MSVYRDFLASLKELSNDSALFKFKANKQTFDGSRDWVYYSGPYWDEREIEAAIRSIVEGKWLSSGEQVMKFERKFSKMFNHASSVMVNSGSSANLAMIAAVKKYFGWNDGDEIIVSVVGFPTSVSPILQNNLVPIFVDIDWQDLNWDLKQVRNVISSKTRAVLSSPVLGNPYDLDLLLDICGEKIKILADNCDSLGSKWRNRFLTDYAAASSCSFYPAHHISTMEGGMVSSSNEEIVTLARSFAWWGRACYCVGVQNLLSDGTCKKRFSKWIPDCDVVVDHKYVFENIGYNLKPLDLQGAIGVAQLDKWGEIEKVRKENKDAISSYLDKIRGVRVVGEHELATTSWFGVPIVCENKVLKRKLVNHLEANRIQTRNYFAGNILQQPGFSHLGDYKKYPNASRVLEEVFFLGCSPTISADALRYIDDVVGNFSGVE